MLLLYNWYNPVACSILIHIIQDSAAQRSAAQCKTRPEKALRQHTQHQHYEAISYGTMNRKGYNKLGFNPRLDGRPKGSIAIPNRPIPKLCRERAVWRQHGVWALSGIDTEIPNLADIERTEPKHVLRRKIPSCTSSQASRLMTRRRTSRRA